MSFDQPPEDYGDVMTLKEFITSCVCGAFIDYDGFGHPMKDGKYDGEIEIKPSAIGNIPEGTTHMIWYNR